MTRIVSGILLLSFFCISCKTPEKDLPGVYRYEHNTKTVLKLYKDHTFAFSVNNRNPYLIPLDHPDEYFSDTKGTWRLINKKTISLTSQSDTMIYPLVSLQSFPAIDKNWSDFTFYDTYGDTVKILYMQYSDSSSVFELHRSMRHLYEDLTKRDTFEFHFYGYRPYTFISGQKMNQDFKITLKPGFQPNFFRETEFSKRRKQLYEIKRKANFNRA